MGRAIAKTSGSTPSSATKKVTTSADPESVIQEYLVTRNRPFSANDIHSNLRGVINKSVVGKTLTSLSDKKKIVAKTFGKSVIYFPIQSEDDALSSEDLEKLDSEINAFSSELEALRVQTNSLSKAITALNVAPTTNDAIAKCKKLERSNLELESRLRELRGVEDDDEDDVFDVDVEDDDKAKVCKNEDVQNLGRKKNQRVRAVAVDPKEKAAADQTLAKLHRLWLARRRLFSRITEEIAEATEKKPNEIFELVEAESDDVASADPASVLNYAVSIEI